MKTDALSQSVWLFDGSPDDVILRVPDLSTIDGGYILALQFADGAFRLGATCHPSKYLGNWNTNVRRFGAPEIVRVLITSPHRRYTNIKRRLTQILAVEAGTNSPDLFMVSDSDLSRLVGDTFSKHILRPLSRSFEPAVSVHG